MVIAFKGMNLLEDRQEERARELDLRERELDAKQASAAPPAATPPPVVDEAPPTRTTRTASATRTKTTPAGTKGSTKADGDDPPDDGRLPRDVRKRLLDRARSSAGRRSLERILKSAEDDNEVALRKRLQSLDSGAPESIEVKSAIQGALALADEDDADPALVDVAERIETAQREVARERRLQPVKNYRELQRRAGGEFVAPGGRMRMVRRTDGGLVEVDRRVGFDEDDEPVFSEP
jgi:hypothetical protein